MHITINYSTALELEALDPPVVETIADDDDAGVEGSLKQAFETVRIALEPGSLTTKDFGSFPPVQYFRGLFADGWTATLHAIATERVASQVAGTAR